MPPARITRRFFGNSSLITRASIDEPTMRCVQATGLPPASRPAMNRS